MIRRLGSKSVRFCDGVTRRNFLTWGSWTAAGLVSGVCIPRRSRAQSIDVTDRPGDDPAVIMIYLPGGPTQHETFDPKPQAPQEIRGPYGSIATSIPGIRFGEWLPELAKSSDRFSIVRSLVGMQNRHESFQCYTGRPGGRNEDGEPAGGWPSLGSVVSHQVSEGRPQVLPYIDAAPKMSYRPYNNQGHHDAVSTVSWPGFTGRRHAPFALEGQVANDLAITNEQRSRLADRQTLLRQLQSTGLPSDEAWKHLHEQAVDMLSTDRLANALDLEREPQQTRDWYGESQPTDPSFGGAPQSPQHLLMARRLVEAGARCVTVAFGAWDWHANREGNIEHLAKKYLPVFDRALARLLEDLEQRGLLSRVTVVVWGEFGRTPRINAKGGRDHWPGTQSVLLAGGGIQGGRVVGSTDPHGGTPAERPVHVQEVFATLYRNLGIDVNHVKIPDLTGRPRYLVDENRQPISELY